MFPDSCYSPTVARIYIGGRTCPLSPPSSAILPFIPACICLTPRLLNPHFLHLLQRPTTMTIEEPFRMQNGQRHQSCNRLVDYRRNRSNSGCKQSSDTQTLPHRGPIVCLPDVIRRYAHIKTHMCQASHVVSYIYQENNGAPYLYIVSVWSVMRITSASPSDCPSPLRRRFNPALLPFLLAHLVWRFTSSSFTYIRRVSYVHVPV